METCHKYHFEGINIDLEELDIDDNALLTNFVAELYRIFHDNNMYVTQDVAPFNEDYDMPQLVRYNDYLFLMAYDEHNATSQPGDIASQHWMERATDWAARNIPNDKLVLALAAYGYDWSKSDGGNTVSFDQAIATAYDTGTRVNFDDDTYNLSYSYYDDNNEFASGVLHRRRHHLQQHALRRHLPSGRLCPLAPRHRRQPYLAFLRQGHGMGTGETVEPQSDDAAHGLRQCQLRRSGRGAQRRVGTARG